MPSKTPKQARFMRAVAHGWNPSRVEAPPVSVAREFVEADRKYSGGFAENRYARGGLSAMNEVDSGSERQRPLNQLNWRRGGRTRRIDGDGGGIGLGGLSTESPYTVEEQAQRDAFLRKDIQPDGVWSTLLYNLQQQNLPPVEPTIAAPTESAYSGPRMVGPKGGRRGGRGGRRRDGGGPRGGGGPGGGGPGGGPGTTPPRIIPTDPAAYVGASSDTSGRASPYRRQLRQHQQRIEDILGSARGGHVTGYAEGGTARADNPFDPVAQKYQWRSWERKQGRDPDAPDPAAAPPPEPPPAAVEEDGGIAAWLRGLFAPDPETANVERIEERMREMEQARGGRVNYQAGGLATAAPGRITPPVGGVPPWIEPMGSGPGYGDEPQGYQFGGIAARYAPPPAPAAAPAAAQPYRGVPPQRGMISRGATGSPSAMAGRMRGMVGAQREQLPGPMAGVQGRAAAQLNELRGAPQPQGGLAAMMQRAQQQAGAPGGGQFGGMLGREESMADKIARAQRMATGQQTYADVVASGGGGVNPIMNEAGDRLTDLNRGPGGGGMIGRPGYDQIGDMGPVHPGRGPFRPSKPRPAPGTFGPGEGIPGGGNIPPWKRLPGGRPQVPPSPGGGIPGGPMVPPNLRGYLQKQRMMNRPRTNVGGAEAQRVGMGDQQGALARAMQRGTGRAPMSRRSAFGRAGP